MRLLGALFVFLTPRWIPVGVAAAYAMSRRWRRMPFIDAREFRR